MVHCSAMDLISRMVPHNPPKGLLVVRHTGLSARCIRRQLANKALAALQLQIPLLVLKPLTEFMPALKWHNRIPCPTRPGWAKTVSYNLLESPNCGRVMQLAFGFFHSS
jgi:hypothetical protein